MAPSPADEPQFGAQGGVCSHLEAREGTAPRGITCSGTQAEWESREARPVLQSGAHFTENLGGEVRGLVCPPSAGVPRPRPAPPNSAHSSRFGCTDHPEIPWPDTTARAPQVPDRGGRGPWRSSETTAPRSQRPEWGGRPGPPLLLRGGGAQHAPVHLTKQPSTPDEERDPRAERSRGAWEEGLGRTAEAVGVQERVDQRARGWEGKGTRARSEAANRSSSKRTRRGGNEKIKVIINTISPTERQKLLVRTCAATRVALQF